MIHVEETLELRLSPDGAFAYLSDFRNLPRWDPGITQVHLLGDEVREGAVFEVVARFLGRRVPLRYGLRTFAPDRREAVLVGEGEGVRATDTIHVDLGPGGGSRVTWAADFELTGPARFLEPLAAPLFRRLSRKAMAGLRAAHG